MESKGTNNNNSNNNGIGTENKLYSGNYFWILEALKVVNKEINFDMPFKNRSNTSDEIIFYDCIVYQEDKEDSLYIQIENTLFEYFSNDKYELLLKLIKLYKNRYCPDNILNLQNSKNFLPDVKINLMKEPINNFNVSSGESFRKLQSRVSSTNLNSVMYVNLLLVYKDNTSKWVYKYEIKKILFYLKFLPNAKNIKVIRLFPLEIKKLNIKSQAYMNKEDEFTEAKDEMNKKTWNLKTREEKLFENLVDKLKNIFFTKYSLVLKYLNIDTFELDNVIYLYDVKEMIFEKYDDKNIKIKTERKLMNFRDKYQYKNLRICKDAPNIKEIKQFFFTGLEMYEQVKRRHELCKYLSVPTADPTTDTVFKELRPNCPYKYSQLIGEKVSKKDFVRYASTNFWNI